MALIGKIARRTPAELLFVIEAWVLLAWFRLKLTFVPVKKIIPTLTRKGAYHPATPAEAAEIARRVQWAVQAAARYSAVEFVCFPQALAGYRMLRRRGVTSTIVYGVNRSPAGELLAHTWLMVDEKMVLGGEAAPEFTPVERWS